jgi:anti-anti-sigma factor
MQFSIAATFSLTEAWFAVSGDLDLVTRDELRRRFNDSEDLGFRQLFLDASSVTFVDCAAMRTIARAQSDSQLAGGRLVVVRPSPSFRRVCRLSGYDEVLAAS